MGLKKRLCFLMILLCSQTLEEHDLFNRYLGLTKSFGPAGFVFKRGEVVSAVSLFPLMKGFS